MINNSKEETLLEQDNRVMLSDIKEKTQVSARVNGYLMDRVKDSNIPTSLIVECGIIYFMTLSDDDKIEFIASNNPESTRMLKINPTDAPWKDMLKTRLEDIKIPDRMVEELLSGSGVNAAIIVNSLNEQKRNLYKEEE